MKNNTPFKLLYNTLWLADKDKLKAINSELDCTNHYKALQIKPLAKKTILPIKIEDNIENNVTNNSLEWKELITKITSCQKCKLSSTRKNVVVERGNRQAKWLFVGEGPGENEDKKGIPFVGVSGQLLDQMIKSMKLDLEQDVYICNIVKCQPPRNRNPEIKEIELCKDYLLNQIDLVKPQIIVTLGRFASQSLLNTKIAIGRLRNQIHFYQNIPLIVTFHPSYLLRNPTAKKDAWQDLQLAMKTFQGESDVYSY